MNRTGLAVCSWLLLVAGGFGLLTRYSLQAGDAVGVLATWPVESRIPCSRDGMTLVVFLHPHCACSHATVEELSKLQSPEALIAVSELADSSVNFVVRPWVQAADYWAVKFDITETVKKRFDAEGIGIPYPQMDLHVSNTNKVA